MIRSSTVSLICWALFTVAVDAQPVLRLTPPAVSTSGGTVVTVEILSGESFLDCPVLECLDSMRYVRIDGQLLPRESWDVVSDSTMWFVAPAHGPGTVQVEIRRFVDTLTTTVTYVDPAHVTPQVPTVSESGAIALGTLLGIVALLALRKA